MKNFLPTLRSRSFASFHRTLYPRTFLGTQTQITRGFNTTPFLWNDDNAPIRINESVSSIEGELSTLFKESYNDPTVRDTIENFQLKKDMLAGHGMELIEEEFGNVSIKGSKEGRSFVVSWDPEPVENEQDDEDYDQEDYEDENDRESDTEDRDPDEQAELSDEEPADEPEILDVTIKVTKDKDAAELILKGGVNADGQLLLYSIGSDDKPVVYLSELSESIQHKMYDYLDELGIGDGTARFINDYNEYRRQRGQMDTLKYAIEFFE